MKRKEPVNSSNFLCAARIVVFFMTCTMLFIPIAPLMIGCQSTQPKLMGTVGLDSLAQPVHDSGSPIVAVLREASIGGIGGEIIVGHMDEEAKILNESLKDALVERIEEGIVITFDSRLLFKDDCYDLQWSAKNKLKEVARFLLANDQAQVLIEGHTDNTAEASYNFLLSEKRASAVETYLVDQGIETSRLRARGFGEKQPLVSNDSERGKQINRRIEVALYIKGEGKTVPANLTARNAY